MGVSGDQTSQRWLQAVIDGSPAIIFVKDRAGRYLLVNRRLEESVHQRRETLIGKTVYEVFPEDVARLMEQGDRQVLETGAAMEFEDVAPIDDVMRTFMTHKFPLFDASGSVCAVCGIATDITDRKLAEQKLRESEARFRQMAGHIDQVFWLTTPEVDRVLYASPSYEAIWGRTLEELYRDPQSFLEGVHPEDRAGVVEHMRALPAKKAVFVYRVVRPDGETRWVKVRSFPITDRKGCVYRLAGVVQDITREHRLEAGLERSREELRRLTARLFSVQEEERRRLALELHDDWNQRLAILAMEIQTLAAQAPPSHGFARDKLRDLHLSAEQLLTDLNRTAYQLHPSMLEDLGLTAALESSISEFARRERIRVRLIRRNVPKPLPLGVAASLFRLAQEALRNVAQHSGARRVTVKLEGADGRLRLAIRDYGAGFDSSTAVRGLGIISMEERTRLLNGDFSLRSKPSRGTLVTVSIPL